MQLCAGLLGGVSDAWRLLGSSRADIRHHVCCAGLINTHHHMFQALTRCIAQDQKLFGWLKAMYAGWQHIKVLMAPPLAWLCVVTRDISLTVNFPDVCTSQASVMLLQRSIASHCVRVATPRTMVPCLAPAPAVLP